MPWLGPVPISQKWRKKWTGFTEDFYVTPVCINSAIFNTLFSLLPDRTFQVIKGKEKKQIIFLYISIVVFLCCMQHIVVNINHNSLTEFDIK